MNISTRIKNLRISKSMTQKELSLLVNSSVVTIQCWENGAKKPSAEALILLSKALNVSADYILGISKNKHLDSSLVTTKNEKALIDDYRLLDDYGKKAVYAVCAIEKSRVLDGMNYNAKSDIRFIPKYTTPSAAGSSVPLGNEDCEMIPVADGVPIQADFAVKIQGDSMLPVISDGEIVYVMRTADIHNGDIGIFDVNGSMYCKHYSKDKKNNITLVSANPNYKDTNVVINADSSDSITCYGKVLLKKSVGLPKYFTLC